MSLPYKDMIVNQLDEYAKTYGMSIVKQAINEWRKRKRTVEHPEKYIRISLSDKQKLYAEQSGICADKLCPNEQPILFNNMECDEIVPRAQGGTNRLSNRQLLCRDCNRKKSSKSLSQLSKEGHGTVTEQLS